MFLGSSWGVTRAAQRVDSVEKKSGIPLAEFIDVHWNVHDDSLKVISHELITVGLECKIRSV